MVWGHITVGAQLTVYTICWLPCLSKYVMVANSVLYVWAGLGWRSAGGDSLGLREGQTDREKTAACGHTAWEQGRGEAGQSTNMARGWRHGKPSPDKESWAFQTHLLQQRIPAKKQVAEAEKELRKKTLIKHMGQHRGERRRPRRQMERTKAEGGKKKKGDKSVANNGPAVAKEGDCDRTLQPFDALSSFPSGLVQPGLGTGQGRHTGLNWDLPHARAGNGGSGCRTDPPLARLAANAGPSTSKLTGLKCPEGGSSFLILSFCKKPTLDLLGYSRKLCLYLEGPLKIHPKHRFARLCSSIEVWKSWQSCPG